MVAVFSVPAFFIVLREVLEACLVIGVALAYFQRTGATQYNRWVWMGACGGIVVSFIFGITFASIFFVKGNQIFSDRAEKVFEGIMFLIAAGLLTWMVVWMMYMGKQLKSRLEQQLDAIIDDAEEKSPGRKKAGVFTMVFVQVLREGIETFIFLFGSANADEVGGWRSIPLPGILALVVGVTVSYLVFKGLVTIDIQSFFNVSSVILIAFAAGLTSHAFHELQEADWFGLWDSPNGRDWYNEAMWKTENCCQDKDNQFFAMLRALFGYQDKPTFIEWVTYFAYWLLVAGLYVVINWQQIRSSRTHTMARAQQLSAMSLIATFVGFIFVLTQRSLIGLLSMILAFSLSSLTVLFIFDPIALKLVPFIASMRRTGLAAIGIAWCMLTLLMLGLHLGQLICIGGNTCPNLGKFYFFGLVLGDTFNNMGRTQLVISDTGEDFTFIWPSIAVLSISLVLTVFFFGGMSFRLLLAAMNVSADGEYMYDNYSKLEESSVDGGEADDYARDGSPKKLAAFNEQRGPIQKTAGDAGSSSVHMASQNSQA